jgi:uncharacterized protein YbjT (DUF2867 family)
MILVTGATGLNGVALLKRLSAHGVAVRAFVRDRVHAQMIALPGVEIVQGDFSRPETFPPALEGIDQLFLLAPSSADVERQQCSFVDAAKHGSVRHIVKLSQLSADQNSSGRFQRHHGAVEDYIRESGIAFTFLRPNLFMQSLLNFRGTILAQGVFYGAAGNAKVSLVDVRDVATIAALALTQPGHEGKTYQITGPESLTHAALASELSTATGRCIEYVDVSPEALSKSLHDFGMPSWQADGLGEDYALYRRGDAARVTTDVLRLTGREATRFSKFARDYANAFRQRDAG